MQDASIHNSIETLVAEEHKLWSQGENGGLDAGEKARLKDISVQLDRFYDLLHQRTALRAAGGNPADAKMRDAETVEGYVE